MNSQNTQEKRNILQPPINRAKPTMFYNQITSSDLNQVTNSQLEEHLLMNVTKQGFDDYRYEYKKEAMFEKPLTPSDVGKLNRLVIPKQHAESHLPPTGITSTGEKGIILSFEDESGKCWRFRHSYWTSSQSYVLTKGWSRFVKEKQLDAGDTILFERQFMEDGYRFFIGWRRRHIDTHTSEGAAQPPVHHHPADSGGNVQSQLGGGRSKILRLFGVNMEYEFESPTQNSSSPSSHGHGSTHGTS